MFQILTQEDVNDERVIGLCYQDKGMKEVLLTSLLLRLSTSVLAEGGEERSLLVWEVNC